MAPVTGSGDWPAWTARVPKPRDDVSMRGDSRMTRWVGTDGAI
jgi:hypothetical protein